MKNKLYSSVVLLLITLFIQPLKSFNPKVSNLPEKKAVPVANMCGPSYTFYNGSSQTVTTIDINKPGQPTLTYNNPSFPLYVYPYDSPNLGATSIVIYFESSSGSGTIKLTYSYNGEQVACETFQNPALSPLYFSSGCISYSIIISDNTSCDYSIIHFQKRQ